MSFLYQPQPGDDSWFRSAGDPSKLISIARFISDDVFATRSGGYGTSFRVAGLDVETLSEPSVCAIAEELLNGLRLVPEHMIVYQIAIKRQSGFVPILRHTESTNRVVAETQRTRQAHLAQVGFRSLELYLTLYVPPSRSKHWGPRGHARASEVQLRDLEATALMLMVNLERFGLQRLTAAKICHLYSQLANLRDDVPAVPSFERVAQHLPVEAVEWTNTGLKVGSRYAKVFSLLQYPVETHPNLYGELLRLDGDMALVLETRRCTQEETLAAISRQETFTNLFREQLMTLVAYLGDIRQLQAKPKSAASHAADATVSGLGGIVSDVKKGVVYTQTSLLGILHSTDERELDTQMAHLQRVAGASKAVFLQEGIGALSGYVSLFPGAMMAGRSTNVRRHWLREEHVADLSLMYAPYKGEAVSATLEDEAHAIFETRDGVEFSYDAYTAAGVRGCFVFGETGSGKSFLLNFIIDNEPKYGGHVFVFDVGGSFEHTILKHGGRVIRFGLSGPRLNPFSLPDNGVSHRFVQRLIRMLLVKGGAPLSPQQETEINERVLRMFTLPRSVRRLKHLILPSSLQPYLDKWIEGGVYGNIFDNLDDELELSRMVAFDFEALGEGQEQRDLMEPLLSWIRWRINDYTHDANNLGVPKLEVYDECWRHLRDEQMSSMIVATTKTARKHLGGIMLATQSAEDLGSHAQLIRTNCPDAILMSGSIDRQQYATLFDLNPRQLDLIASLQRGEFLLARKSYSKVLRLSVDEASKWLYSTHPQDRKRRAVAIEEYGREAAFNHLVAAATAK